MRSLTNPLSENHKAVISQTLIQVSGKVITVIGSFLVVRMIASQHGLGLNGFGDYVLVTSFVAYFYLLLDFGFNTIFVQKAHNHPECQAQFFSQLLTLRLGISVFLLFVGLAVLSFLPSQPYGPAIKLGIIASLTTIVMQGLFMTGNAYFQLKLTYQLSVAVVAVAAIVNLAATYIALQVGSGLSGVLVAYIAEYVLLGVGAMILVRRYVPWKLFIDWLAWKQFVLDAMPLGLSIVLTLLYFRSDLFLLSVLPLSDELGITNQQAVSLYNIPYAIFEVFLTLPAFIMNAAYPLMLRAYSQSWQHLRSLMWQTVFGSVAVAGCLSVGIWLFAPLVIHLQTDGNPDFAPSSLVLRLLALALPAFFVTNVLVFTLISLGQKKLLPLVYAVAGIVNISINLWLIPQFGTIVAALTTGITEIVILVLLIGLTWSAFGQAGRLQAAEVSD